MNCRTHEHRRFERTLRSSDTVPGPRLAEGRINYQTTARSTEIMKKIVSPVFLRSSASPPRRVESRRPSLRRRLRFSVARARAVRGDGHRSRDPWLAERIWEFAGVVRGRLERRNGAGVSLKYASADNKAPASDSARRVLGRSSSACGGRRVLDS